MVRKLGDLHQVVCHARHDLTGFVVVKVSIGQTLQMVEHVGSHLCLHADTDHMTPILHKVAQIHTDNIQKQKSRTADDEHADVLIGNKVLQHQIGQDRIQHTDDGNEQGRDHVQNEHLLVRLVIRNKPFQHKKSFLFI